MEIYRQFSFDAAHRLPNLPASHGCITLHGHTFSVTVFIEGEVQREMGWVRDFGEIKAVCAPFLEILDHSYLNEIKGLENPTSEHIAMWLWAGIKPLLPGLSMIEVKETRSTGCRYRG